MRLKLSKKRGVRKRIDASVSSAKKAAKNIAVDRTISEVIAIPVLVKKPYSLKMVDNLNEIGHEYDIYGSPRSDFVINDAMNVVTGAKLRTIKRNRVNKKKRYYMSQTTTGDAVVNEEERHDDTAGSHQQPQSEPEEQLPIGVYEPRGSRGDAPRGVIDKIRSVLEYKRAHKNFAYKHHLMRDSQIVNRFWLDQEHYIDVDIFDPISVKQAEIDIYEFKRNPAVVRASPEYLAKKNQKGKKGIRQYVNPEALIPLYDSDARYNRPYGDRNYGSRYYGGNVSPSFEDILHGDHPESASVIFGNHGYPGQYPPRTKRGKKKIPPDVIAAWYTDTKLRRVNTYRKSTRKTPSKRK